MVINLTASTNKNFLIVKDNTLNKQREMLGAKNIYFYRDNLKLVILTPFKQLTFTKIADLRIAGAQPTDMDDAITKLIAILD